MKVRGKSGANHPDAAHLRRWRLALGRYGQNGLGGMSLSRQDQRCDAALEYIYGREMARRGMRADAGGQKGGGASLDPSQLTLPRWIGEVRELFPQSVSETIQSHALDRYEMTDLLKDPKVLESLEPNVDLLKSMMMFRDQASSEAQQKIREIARRVVEEIIRKLKPKVDRALSGQRNRFARSSFKSMRNFDWRGTLRENLKTWDPERQRIIAERLRFYARKQRRLPWTVILCVDQSGSMLDSVIHSAVMAAILAGLPSVKLHLVVFDTSVVDLSHQVDDPVATLLSVQLGGGTDIGRAVRYCEQLVVEPARTVFVLISDFEEGGPPSQLIGAVRRLNEARVTLLGLASLTDGGSPWYDKAMAERLAGSGMHIAALSPENFAEWLGGVIS